MQFEYKVEGGVSEERLNQLGALGWDLVSIEGNKYTFKRPKPQEAVPTRETFDARYGVRESFPPMPKAAPPAPAPPSRRK